MVAQQSLVVDDSYNKLREAQGLLPMPEPSAQVTVGTLDASSGSFTGLQTSYVRDPLTNKPRAVTPGVSLNGIDIIAVFSVTSGPLTVTANGRTATGTGSGSINVGRARKVEWTMQAGPWARSDKFNVSRPSSGIGAGAFTVAAMPISIVDQAADEPGANQLLRRSGLPRRDDHHHIGLERVEQHLGAEVGDSESVMKDILDGLKYLKPVAAAKSALALGKTLLGNVEVTRTTGTTVNNVDRSRASAPAQTISTNARLGPGLADLARSSTRPTAGPGGWSRRGYPHRLYGPLVMVTIATLRNELAVVRAGFPHLSPGSTYRPFNR